MQNEEIINRYIFIELLIYVAAGYFVLSDLWISISDKDHSYIIAVFITMIVWRSAAALIIKFSSSDEVTERGLIHWPSLSSGLITGLTWGGLPIFLYLLNIDVADQDFRFALANAAIAMIVLPASGLIPSSYLGFALPLFGLPLALSLHTDNIILAAIWGVMLLISLIIANALQWMGRMVDRYQRSSKENKDIYSKLAASRDKALLMMRELESANLSIQDEVRERQLAEEKIAKSEKELGRILQDMTDTYFRVDKGGKVTRISPSVRQLLGMNPEQIIGTTFSSLFNDERQYKILNDELAEHFGVVENLNLQMMSKQGVDVWVSINAHEFKDQDGEFVGYEGIARDITESRIAAEALYQEKERIRVTLESIGDAVITTNTACEVEYINPVGERVTGWDTKEAYAKRLEDVLQLFEEDHTSRVKLPFDKWVKEGKSAALAEPALLISKDEKSSVIELNGAPIFDSKNQVIGTVLVFHDVTKLRTLATELSYQATHDSLTGLVNRLEFDNLVQNALDSAKHDGINHVLCYIDLDYFKAVNDTSGHQAGDEMLRQITKLMQSNLRKSDTLGRLGGDEFGLLLNGCDIERGKIISENIRAAVDQHRLVWNGNAHRVGTSIGLVAIDNNSDDITHISRDADSACYLAKEEGRNRVHVLMPNDEKAAGQHGNMLWIQRIQHALENDLFELYSQPIENLNEKDTTGRHIELLLRMVDSDDSNKRILPGSFFPAAERYHLMPQIDMWVIKNAFAKLIDEDGAEVEISTCAINLSGQSLSDKKLYSYILKMFEQSGVSPNRICFEITESAVIANSDIAKEFIQGLRKIGCRFALNDFGSGFNAFDYLKHLPVDYIKLDGSMIHDIAKNRTSLAMVKAINYISQVMGMKSIAGFVENKETLEALKSININYAQGYFLGKPELFENNSD